ncbi:hypothetical protein B0T22DRAFT_529330 [Podospora appendiculata]|uniref:Aminoglycoside phosphotransferase domain-containing protein n=1 Tax=Podospora appendiculata TaxID=314037 RepID=A0AAE0X557_9PEZI|nr:hypothetical protein B0T22DRAFT_529330 [Podospora appendiculata]
MPETLRLDHRGPITLESALDKDLNIINETSYFAAAEELYQVLWVSRRTIEALVRHHLALGNGESCKCVVEPRNRWLRGSFNVCVPVEVQSRGAHKLVFRCAMPHKLAEARYPDTVDEKMSFEVGTYVWMQDWCADVRIPHLYWFGFSDHRHFTCEDQMPFYVRLWRAIQTPPPPFERRGDPVRRQRLFQGMARAILSLARVPQPRIGSFEFRPDGTVTLTSRPWPCCVAILENGGAPRIMPRGETYTCVEPFVADMLAFHDESFLTNKNAVFDASDCRGQMTARAILRTLSHHYVSRARRGGPFRLQLTDFHASNIFVDDDWNVTCLIDLEWICSLPAENDDLCEFDKVHQEFLEVLEEEEIEMTPGRKPALANILRESWESGAVWFCHCLLSGCFPNTGVRGSTRVVSRKVDDYEEYAKELEHGFNKAT